MDRIILFINDYHAHLRQFELMKAIIQLFNMCNWVVAMRNLDPYMNTRAYSMDIAKQKPRFKTIMTVMFTRNLTPEKLREEYKAGNRILKLIPGGSSTNSDDCVRLHDLLHCPRCRAVLETADELGMVFSIHLELAMDENGSEINRLYRETAAMKYLIALVEIMPGLKISVEHISTYDLLELVLSLSNNVFGTMTAQHCVLSQLDLTRGGKINPHLLCNPILKGPDEAYKLLLYINSLKNKKIGFGSDCAAHWRKDKELLNKYGIFGPPPISIPLIIQKSKEMKVFNIEALQNFFYNNLARIYNLPAPFQAITLIKKPWQIAYEFRGIVPLWAGKILKWQIDCPETALLTAK